MVKGFAIDAFHGGLPRGYGFSKVPSLIATSQFANSIGRVVQRKFVGISRANASKPKLITYDIL
jgi:hypothetical protein